MIKFMATIKNEYVNQDTIQNISMGNDLPFLGIFEHWSRGCNSLIHSCLTIQRMAANRTAATANLKEIFR